MTKPAELVMMARLARGYYLEDRSKTDLAEELGISRFRVARLLGNARRTGLVRIEIDSPRSIDVDLSARLQQHFGLAHCVVVDQAVGTTPATGDAVAGLRSRLSAVAADLLGEIVTDQDVLGLAWARSVRSVGQSLSALAPCRVVQLTGAISGPDGSDVLGLVRSVAGVGGGPAHVFYAPMVTPDAAAARAIRRQSDVQAATSRFPDVTIAVVGIGVWAPGLSTVYDSFDAPTQRRCGSAGVVADVAGVLLDGTGAQVSTAAAHRIIGISGEQLAQVPLVLGIAYDDQKEVAVRAALRGGWISGLITHASLAERLLSPDDQGAP